MEQVRGNLFPFEQDINKIVKSDIQSFVKKVLYSFPEYFWTQPASSTGKYHPSCTIREGGLLVHTKRVIWFGEQLIRAHRLERRLDADLLMAAFILHDGQKGGKGYGNYDDYTNHPILVRDRYIGSEYNIKGENPEESETIFEIVKHHMGPWTPPSVKKPMSAYSELELIMYHADYLAAQKDLATPVDNVLDKVTPKNQNEQLEFNLEKKCQ